MIYVHIVTSHFYDIGHENVYHEEVYTARLCVCACERMCTYCVYVHILCVCAHVVCVYIHELITLHTITYVCVRVHMYTSVYQVCKSKDSFINSIYPIISSMLDALS